jgi:hypothetical protein
MTSRKLPSARAAGDPVVKRPRIHYVLALVGLDGTEY